MPPKRATAAAAPPALSARALRALAREERRGDGFQAPPPPAAARADRPARRKRAAPPADADDEAPPAKRARSEEREIPAETADVDMGAADAVEVGGNQVEGNQVGGNQVEGNQVEGNQVEGNQVEGNQVDGKPLGVKPIGGKPFVGKPVRGKPIVGKPIVGKPIHGNPIGEKQVDTESDGSETAEEPPLAVAVQDWPVTFAGEEATLRATLRIRRCFVNLFSRIHYDVQFLLVIGPTHEAQACGYIDSWRVDKPTTTQRAKPTFVEEFLQGPFLEMDPNLRDMGLVMRMLYTRQGRLRPSVPQRLAPQLLDNRLLFVQTVVTRPQFQRQRLLRHMLTAFHSILAHPSLPEWFQFSGTLILIPCPPGGEYMKGWERTGTDIEEAKRILRNSYRRYGRYKLWLREGQALDREGNTHGLMGRVVPDSDDDEDDDEMSEAGSEEEQQQQQQDQEQQQPEQEEEEQQDLVEEVDNKNDPDYEEEDEPDAEPDDEDDLDYED